MSSASQQQQRKLPKTTGSTEGFYRSVYSTNTDSTTTAQTNSNKAAQTAMAQEVVKALDFNATTGTRQQGMEKPAAATPPRPKGTMKSPRDIGVPEAPKPTTTPRAANNNPRLSSLSRMRSIRAIQSTMSPAAAAAAAASVSFLSQSKKQPSMVCSLAHRGMEVIFSIARNQEQWSIVGVCARTRVAFQTLDLPYETKANVVSMTGDPTTGMIAVALSDGVVQTYIPVEASPGPSSNPQAVVAAFGRFRWINGRAMHCAQVFYAGTDESNKAVFDNIRSGRDTGAALHISSSVDYKVLVGHRDQLAIFDALPLNAGTPVLSLGESNSSLSTEEPPAVLLWTTKTHANIVTAKLSGDGQAIVVVLEGEGVGTPDPVGARTFVRDLEDGSVFPLIGGRAVPRPQALADPSRQSSVGILYKPGPFLVHSTGVTRVSFRGLGHNTSNVHPEEDEGNDLLLTYCAQDCSVRIFSQNSWKQLMHWTTPPNSRADWVRGISAFTLGDLESTKKKKPTGSRSVSRRPSFGSAAGDESSGGSGGAINRGLLGARPFSSVAAQSSSAPSSAAGAWIAELTFRNTFPALRLSRLTYMKRGNDDAQPAHFESVAAILPAGSIVAGSVLDMEEMGWSVQGIWPAWNPWFSGAAGAEASGSLSGSAMALLGFPTASGSLGGAFGGTHLGGTHSPPSELRLVASHPQSGKVILMEFPLWGDQDFGAMELGSPLRYVLSLSEDPRIASAIGSHEIDGTVPVCMDHESSRLCARIEPGAKSVSLTWRKPGSMYILPPLSHLDNLGVSTEQSSIASTVSVDSNQSYRTFDSDERDLSGPEPYTDISVVPVPLALPTLRLPRNGCTSSDETLLAVMWWPDDNFGGPPHLVAVTSHGTIIVYEMPPPWSSLEPSMPSYDPFDASAASSLAGGDVGSAFMGMQVSSDEDSTSESEQKEYETMITPHPDFGIGLRLESQADGMPAIAGSYKKNPLTGGRLPAERTGMIFLGDELLAINGVNLEGLSFDEIIGTVRKVGSEAASGAPLCMRFRPKATNRRRLDSGAAFGTSAGSNRSPQLNGRRTMEQMLGVAPKQKKKQDSTANDDDSDDSHVSMLVGAENEMQQEFSRIVAIVRHGVHIDDIVSGGSDAQSLVSVLPWHVSRGAPNHEQPRGAALLVSAGKNTLCTKRIEIAIDGDADKARCHELGTLELECTPDASIRCLCVVKPGTDHWCLAVCDTNGAISLVFIEVEEVDRSSTTKSGDGRDSSPSESLRAIFRCHRVFQCDTSMRIQIRAASVELMATMPMEERCRSITVWSALPLPTDEDENESQHSYMQSRLSIDTPLADGDSANDEIIDFRFVPSGSLDAFPWIVIFTRTAAILHRRSGSSYSWEAIAELTYSGLDCSNKAGLSPFERPNHVIPLKTRLQNPSDVYPHLLSALHNVVSASDETKFTKSDWDPESILAYVCTEEEGAKKALRRSVRGIYVWLSRWMSTDDEKHPSLNMQFPLGVTPLSELKSDENVENDVDDDSTQNIESASNLMASLLLKPEAKAKPPSEDEKLLHELQTVLCPSNRTSNDATKKKVEDKGKRSKEFLLTMGHVSQSERFIDTDPEGFSLPPPLKKLGRDEIHLLWALGEVLGVPPRFKNLDIPGQLTLFCASLLRQIYRAQGDGEDAITQKDSTLASERLRVPINGHSSRETSGTKRAPAIASAGSFSALVSNNQGLLLETCRIPNEKMDWATARQLRLPFWIRSDSELRRIAEEIGQRTYRDTRDVMECALFFVAVSNMRTLRNLAATDQSHSGRTFLKFITSHDFSSQRGRKTAEKNAYSLLRKRRYGVAASFFLLTKPPMLKTALEVIVTQMEDLDLAFMVARLLESALSSSLPGGSSVDFPSGSIDLRGMGGGGGFASVGNTTSGDTQSVEAKFREWKPSLGTGARNLINERGFAVADDDYCLRATQLMWLGRPIEASQCLCLVTSGDSGKRAADQRDVLVPQFFDDTLRFAKAPNGSKNLSGAANARVAAKANSLINFSSCPLLLQAMQAHTRERWASALLVSRALSRRGIEIPSFQVLLHATDPRELEEESAKENMNGKGNLDNQISSATTSKFNAVKVPKPSTNSIAASIFDSFDCPPQNRHQKVPFSTPNDTMGSSIFDAFDAPPSKSKPSVAKQAPASRDAMSSSIFDAFDAPHPKSKSEVPTQASTPQDTMSSSIFDEFDAPAPKTKSSTGASKQSHTMSSSIFDSFDVPTRNVATQTSVSSTNTEPLVRDSPLGPVTTSSMNDVETQVDDVATLPTPRLWLEWRANIVGVSVARRFVRELARIVARFHGDAVDAPMKLFRRHIHPLVPNSAAEILRSHCDGEALLSSVRRCLVELCELSNLGQPAVLDHSLYLLASQFQPKRIIFMVVLYTVMDRADLAEDIIRDASHTLMRMCEGSAFSNDDLVHNRKTYGHLSSQYMRRQAARMSWQLELCLWLHRGGTFPLSVTTIKEAVVAVRVGLFVASWGRSHECIEKMFRCEPDCEMDYEAGRQLWASMKLISTAEEQATKTGGATSGGWEFLVDCSRDEATETLRNRQPGSFIIRPHSEDHGVFTLSFKTNLTPTVGDDQEAGDANSNEVATPAGEDSPGLPPKPNNARPVKKDEVVQHAIIRLSDSGFRCGSFGPFSSLMKLLEAVSGSLPFPLLFHEPPTERIIQDQGTQPSPNSLMFRKLALTSQSETLRWNSATRRHSHSGDSESVDPIDTRGDADEKRDAVDKNELSRKKRFGLFSLLLAISEVRRSLSAVSAAEYEDFDFEESKAWESETHPQVANVPVRSFDEDSVGSMSYATDDLGVEELYADATRILRPFLYWCRLLEVAIALELAPTIDEVTPETATKPVALVAFDTAIEVAPTDVGSCIDGGDAVIRQLIQPDSGVEFRTLRVGEGGDSAMLVLFSKQEAIQWFVATGNEKNTEDATARLEMMEKRRVIEEVDLDELGTEEHEIRYRFVDPWEVEALGSKEGETMAASLGREHYYEFSVSRVARSCEFIQRSLGGLHLMGLWSAAKGGICLTKAIASVHPPWERDSGGDLHMRGGVSSEPSAFSNSIRQHLYRNALFRRLKLPQRFLALVQVELLDLKNLTSPGGASSLSVYALLRLKRPGSGAPLKLKARTLDSACTPPTKIGKSSGPNAPASWGSLVRFRFPLPEDVNCDGISFDGDREALFKGPPCVLQVSVYEKKFMKDIFLGGADVKLDALSGGGQMEEWVPLRSMKDGITWFARIRLTLRFELMCLDVDETTVDRPPSVGLKKIQELSRMGGAHEDTKGVTKSVSTPDLLSYFESMVY